MKETEKESFKETRLKQARTGPLTHSPESDTTSNALHPNRSDIFLLTVH